MKHKAQLSINRPSYSDGQKKIIIRVEDVDAGIQFLELEIDMDKFTECLTGLSGVNCEMEVRGLKNVGKKKERNTIKFKMPKCGYSERKEIAYQEALKHTPEGWIPSSYFSSKGSFFSVDTSDGKQEEWATTSISRWVDKDEH